MKAVINKKRYDTETSIEVASYDSGHSSGDFHYITETLYLTKSNAWFLAGEGGALTEYAVQCGNGKAEGHKIIVLSPEEAYAWLEEHDFPGEIEEYFADTIEDA